MQRARTDLALCLPLGPPGSPAAPFLSEAFDPVRHRAGAANILRLRQPTLRTVLRNSRRAPPRSMIGAVHKGLRCAPSHHLGAAAIRVGDESVLAIGPL
jgi:hypothetical protein